jgi:carbonic anhydrase
MKIYKVLPTGKDQSFIEVVPNAKAESDIQKKRESTLEVQYKEIMINFLRNHHQVQLNIRKNEIIFFSNADYAVTSGLIGVLE